MIPGETKNHEATREHASSDEATPAPGSGALSPRQERAVLALLNNPSIARAAEAVGVDESTMHRWLKDQGFVKALRRARASAFDQAVTLTQRYAGSAVQVLVKVMADQGAPYPSRVAASVALLKFGREGVLLDDLAQRVENLEAAVNADASAGTRGTGGLLDDASKAALLDYGSGQEGGA